ncbi:hypothetical protein XF24_00928 [candidate division SR1 bacterium Aalborg_AAW-1]|nr:hypothetical protein XF24_00928 [candidate division SR1 bacterium Aalborg_AAW-1]
MKHNWTSIIYDIYTYVYWEPQTIDCLRKGNKKYNNESEMIEALHKREVVFNHICNVFLTSLNTDQITHFFNRIVDGKKYMEDFYRIYVRDLSDVVAFDNVSNPTQPDIFLIGDNNTISIELKIGAKSDQQQILKYAFLHSQEYKKSGIKKNHNLILLGKGGRSNFWKEKYDSVIDLKIKCINDIDQLQTKYLPYKDDIIKMMHELDIHYISYNDWYHYLQEYAIGIGDKKIQKNYNDFMKEIKIRNLL